MDKTFGSLKWHRLNIVLININKSQKTKSHGLAITNAIIKKVSLSIGLDETAPVVFHVKDQDYTFKIKEHGRIPVEVFFGEITYDKKRQWVKALKSYMENPITGRNFDLIETGELEERSYGLLKKELDGITSEKEVCLEFLTPLAFSREKLSHRNFITNRSLADCFENRIKRFFNLSITYESGSDNFSTLPYWKYISIDHKASNGGTKYINGCTGRLYLKGRFDNLFPFLMLGNEIHTGGSLTYSTGYYKLFNKSSDDVKFIY